MSERKREIKARTLQVEDWEESMPREQPAQRVALPKLIPLIRKNSLQGLAEKLFFAIDQDDGDSILEAFLHSRDNPQACEAEIGAYLSMSVAVSAKARLPQHAFFHLVLRAATLQLTAKDMIGFSQQLAVKLRLQNTIDILLTRLPFLGRNAFCSWGYRIDLSAELPHRKQHITEIAAYYGDVELLRILRRHGLLADNEFVLLHDAVPRGGHMEVLNYLLDECAMDVNAVRSREEALLCTPLSAAVFFERSTMVRNLLARGADPLAPLLQPNWAPRHIQHYVVFFRQQIPELDVVERLRAKITACQAQRGGGVREIARLQWILDAALAPPRQDEDDEDAATPPHEQNLSEEEGVSKGKLVGRSLSLVLRGVASHHGKRLRSAAEEEVEEDEDEAEWVPGKRSRSGEDGPPSKLARTRRE